MDVELTGNNENGLMRAYRVVAVNVRRRRNLDLSLIECIVTSALNPSMRSVCVCIIEPLIRRELVFFNDHN